ncbi:MAG: S1-like domain-containing RNA-binding protein [Lachnospiraceae bacterium]|nr:S1-like domain-containing RNA-binding protein [Lachnospiraceae bacterium]MDD7326604.1 S1-like domain-containing RNA-binding protein [Lachnospiraceae bacterium]MDY2758735.1 S1-like domain-containing RNA-binding protein [Lachnospiraceae bacterium]
MLELCKYNELKIARFKEFGALLAENMDDEKRVLLPKKEVPDDARTGDTVRVFLYLDTKDRMIATITEPLITMDRPRVLTVKDVTRIGLFLDWGLPKDLLLPFHEIAGRRDSDHRIEAGDEVLVRLYIDKSGRPCASMKHLYDVLSTDSPYQKDDVVRGRIYEFGHDFGTFVAVDDIYSGMIPRHEDMRDHNIGDELELRVTEVKPDGKLSLTTRKDAYQELDCDGAKVMSIIDSYAGVLPFTEKASPEVILRETGLSKAAFKRAVGHLYKERKISLEGGKIRRI